MQITIDRFGRIVIPKRLRDALDLHSGSLLEIELHERQILLRPLRRESDLVEKDGVLVFTGRAAGKLDDALQAHRLERLRELGSGGQR